MNTQPRLRGNALCVSSNAKNNITKEFGPDIVNKKEAFVKYIQEKFYLTSEVSDSEYLDVEVPSWQGVGEKNPNMKISEDAFISNLGIEVNPIKKYPIQCSFKYFLNNFDENRINEFEIQDILSFDFDEMQTIKEKLVDIIDKLTILVSSNTLQQDENGKKNRLLNFLNDKLNEIKKSEKNAKTVINNIEKVKNLVFNEDKITIQFFE
jgi:hypothetical protein